MIECEKKVDPPCESSHRGGQVAMSEKDKDVSKRKPFRLKRRLNLRGENKFNLGLLLDFANNSINFFGKVKSLTKIDCTAAFVILKCREGTRGSLRQWGSSFR